MLPVDSLPHLHLLCADTLSPTATQAAIQQYMGVDVKEEEICAMVEACGITGGRNAEISMDEFCCVVGGLTLNSLQENEEASRVKTVIHLCCVLPDIYCFLLHNFCDLPADRISAANILKWALGTLCAVA